MEDKIEEKVCPDCKGSGKIEIQNNNLHMVGVLLMCDNSTETRTCNRCNGSGKSRQ